MIHHLKNQTFLAGTLAALVVLYHFWERVLPGFGLPMENLEPLRALPYATAIGCATFAALRQRSRNAAYDEFLRESPGKEIDTSSVTYGLGHGHTK